MKHRFQLDADRDYEVEGGANGLSRTRSLECRLGLLHLANYGDTQHVIEERTYELPRSVDWDQAGRIVSLGMELPGRADERTFWQRFSIHRYAAIGVAESHSPAIVLNVPVGDKRKIAA